MILGLYRTATVVAAPLIGLYLARRRAEAKEDGARFPERKGIPGRERPAGPLVWFHGASVGEALSLLVLVERLRAERPRLNVLVTTGTVTSAALMGQRLPSGCLHQYVPVDRPRWVRRFLDHWRPDLAIWAESELWPNLVLETSRRRVPMVLVNGRISERSYRQWRRVPGAIRRLLGAFDLCLAQTDDDGRRLFDLGARQVESPGNLKFAAPPLPADTEELARLGGLSAGRPRWVAASTHAGEEALAGRVHARLARAHPGLLTIVAPRHPARGLEVAEGLRAAGLKVAQRSAGETPGPDTDVYVADTIGEMGLFFRLADAVFVGKSLVPLGGQNPIEPARLGRPVLHGPHMENFRAVAERFAARGAARVVADEAALAAALDRLLSDPEERARLGEAARAAAEAEAGVLPRTLAALAPFLDALDDRRATETAGARA